jgi:inner membrane protein
MEANAVEAGRALIVRLSRPARLIGIAVLALVLLIPLQMVRSVVQERYRTYQEVIGDIAGAWSSDQLLAGPMLIVPFAERVEIRDSYIASDGEKKTTQRWEICRRRAVILPDVLTMDGILVPETRQRGIYRVQVYTADLTVSAVFQSPRAAVEALTTAERLEEIEWSKAVVGFGLSDPRGIVEVDGFELNGRAASPRPGTALAEIVPRGFHVPIGQPVSETLEVRMPMVVRGSGSLRFLPIGEITRASLRSTWPHPSFIGDVLPATRTIDDSGFSAEWTIPLLNRSFPQAFAAGAEISLDEIEAGVRLFEPVALYDLVTRSVKYGLLFVALTFLTLGLIELTTGVRLSLVQFLLIGVALALFFLILVALAEHIGFPVAYLLASSTVVVINTLYCAAILGRRSTAALLGMVLAAIYGVLYTILQAEDYALLGGTLLLVVALAVTMYFTRRSHEPHAL